MIVVNEQMDFRKFGEKPILVTQSNQGSSLLDNTKSVTYDLYLQFNEVNL